MKEGPDVFKRNVWDIGLAKRKSRKPGWREGCFIPASFLLSARGTQEANSGFEKRRGELVKEWGGKGNDRTAPRGCSLSRLLRRLSHYSPLPTTSFPSLSRHSPLSLWLERTPRRLPVPVPAIVAAAARPDRCVLRRNFLKLRRRTPKEPRSLPPLGNRFSGRGKKQAGSKGESSKRRCKRRKGGNIMALCACARMDDVYLVLVFSVDGRPRLDPSLSLSRCVPIPPPRHPAGTACTTLYDVAHVVVSIEAPLWIDRRRGSRIRVAGTLSFSFSPA